jgi:ligand-binding sensor domain-containing protein
MSYLNSLIKNIITLFVFLSGTIFSQQYNFRNYTIEDGLPQSQIYSLYQDSRGYIWGGTIGGGVCYFDGREFKMPEGNNIISGYSVLAIGEDGSGRMLFGVNGEGLFRYDGSDLKHYRIDEKINQVNVFSIFKDSDNNVWIGTNIGTFLFDGHNFIQSKLNAKLRNTNGLATYMDSKGNLWFSLRGGVLKNEKNRMYGLCARYYVYLDVR